MQRKVYDVTIARQIVLYAAKNSCNGCGSFWGEGEVGGRQGNIQERMVALVVPIPFGTGFCYLQSFSRTQAVSYERESKVMLSSSFHLLIVPNSLWSLFGN